MNLCKCQNVQVQWTRMPDRDSFACPVCGFEITGENFDRELRHAKVHPGVLTRDCKDPECQIRYVMES